MGEFFDPQNVYELRPPDGFFRGRFRRYANGQWLPDDGEWDMAFIGDAVSSEGGGYPCCLYYDPPYYQDLIWSWLTTPWTAAYPPHPRANPWHYSLRPGASDRGGSASKDRHVNRIAGDKGMSKIAGERSCANGRHAEFKVGNSIIKAGLFRRLRDKVIVTFPDDPECMYCGLSWREEQADG